MRAVRERARGPLQGCASFDSEPPPPPPITSATTHPSAQPAGALRDEPPRGDIRRREGGLPTDQLVLPRLTPYTPWPPPAVTSRHAGDNAAPAAGRRRATAGRRRRAAAPREGEGEISYLEDLLVV